MASFFREPPDASDDVEANRPIRVSNMSQGMLPLCSHYCPRSGRRRAFREDGKKGYVAEARLHALNTIAKPTIRLYR